MDKLKVTSEKLDEIDAYYHFGRRLMAERLAMNHSAVNITSTRQERLEQYSHHAYRGAIDVNDDPRFAVISPGVNLDIFGIDARAKNETPVRRHVKERLARDISAKRRDLPVIVASSRIDEKKNHLGLVQAFAQSSSLQKLANLVIITGALDNALHEDGDVSPGERAVLAQMRNVIETHDLKGKVSAFAVQGQPALAAAYRLFAERGSVFALTAYYEPFGLAPLEAAATGLPVVVTQNGGPSESLRDGDEEFGVLVDPADPTDIAQGLERLLSSPAEWNRFAQRGRQRVLNRYTWERTAKAYLEIIGQITYTPKSRVSSQRLPIHPYFRNPGPETDVSLVELAELYLTGEDRP
jgi:sucrose-phosphate synthase